MVDGRKNNGGPRPNSGRKSKAEELGLIELLNDAWPVDKQKACIRKLAQDAVSTIAAVRHPARLMLFSYAFGKPTERHELTGADGKDLLPKSFIVEVIGNDDKRKPGKDSNE